MSLQAAEKIFWAIVDSDDDGLAECVAEWRSSYASTRYESYEDGEETRVALREFGFEPTTTVMVSHARVISLAIEAAAAADSLRAASAFILSANPDCEYFQNPLRSVSIIRNVPRHRFSERNPSAIRSHCRICGTSKESEWLPLTAASRFPSGYTGEDWQILDNLMIVRWFNNTDFPKPDATDLSAFHRVLRIVACAAPNDTSVKIASRLKKELKGNIDAWRYFFETLGYAGVLKTDVQPGNLQVWTASPDRNYGNSRSEVPTPCCHWRRSMGFDPEVFCQLFPQIKLPSNLYPK